MAENTKTSIERLLDTHLKGLILPEDQAATEISTWYYSGVVLLVLFLMFGIWRWYKFRQSPQQIALRRIKKLHNFLRLGERHQQIAIQLTSYLRQGLGSTRLDYSQMSESPKRAEWLSFIGKLEAASYAKKPSSIEEMEMLFKQSYQWLKRS
ncbi:MAG: hypothetical protein AB8C40_08670 [Gammaproteobacteria bacterium]